MTYFFWLHVHGLRGTRRAQIFFHVPYEPQASIGKTHGRHSLAPAARTFSHFLSLILKGFYLHFSLCLSPCGSDPVALHPHGYRLIASPCASRAPRSRDLLPHSLALECDLSWHRRAQAAHRSLSPAWPHRCAPPLLANIGCCSPEGRCTLRLPSLQRSCDPHTSLSNSCFRLS